MGAEKICSCPSMSTEKICPCPSMGAERRRDCLASGSTDPEGDAIKQKAIAMAFFNLFIPPPL
jgi:hypothetical protein